MSVYFYTVESLFTTMKGKGNRGKIRVIAILRVKIKRLIICEEKKWKIKHHIRQKGRIKRE